MKIIGSWKNMQEKYHMCLPCSCSSLHAYLSLLLGTEYRVKWSLGLNYNGLPEHWACSLLPFPSAHPILLEQCCQCLWLLKG